MLSSTLLCLSDTRCQIAANVHKNPAVLARLTTVDRVVPAQMPVIAMYPVSVKVELGTPGYVTLATAGRLVLTLQCQMNKVQEAEI